MKLTVLIAIALFGITSAGKVKVKRLDLDGGYEHSGIAVEVIDNYGGHGHGGGKGYSAGSGLRSIAQGSANQAHSAVANQHAAAVQASYVAKSTLAQTAVQASATAQAALAGKQVLLASLESQRAEAHHDLEAELAQLQLSKSAASAAKQVATQAGAHLSILSGALNSAQGVAEHAELAAGESAAELAAQSAMVGKAKGRLQSLQEQLNSALIDYEATKHAAEKASSAAHEAQNNAAAAGAHATIKLHESAAAQQSSGGYEGHGQEYSESGHGYHH